MNVPSNQLTIHLSRGWTQDGPHRVEAEVRVASHLYSNGPYIEVKLALGPMGLVVFVDQAEEASALADALASIVPTLRQYAASKAPVTPEGVPA